jgi:hypothetical protein
MRLTTYNIIYKEDNDLVFKGFIHSTKRFKADQLKSYGIDSKFTMKFDFSEEIISFNAISYRDIIKIKNFMKVMRPDLLITGE